MVLTSPGHPDWQDFPAWRQSPQASGVFTAGASGDNELAVFPTANFASLFMRAFGADSGGQLRVGYADTSAFSPETFSFIYTFNQHTDLAVNVPVLGNWARVDLFAPSTGAVTATIQAFLNNNPAENPHFQNSFNFINEVGFSIPPGAGTNFYLPAIQPGPALLYIGPYASAAGVIWNLRTMFDDGSFGSPIDFESSPPAQVQKQIYLPNRPVQWNVNNTTASALQADMAIWPIGGEY